MRASLHPSLSPSFPLPGGRHDVAVAKCRFCHGNTWSDMIRTSSPLCFRYFCTILSFDISLQMWESEKRRVTIGKQLHWLNSNQVKREERNRKMIKRSLETVSEIGHTNTRYKIIHTDSSSNEVEYVNYTIRSFVLTVCIYVRRQNAIQ